MICHMGGMLRQFSNKGKDLFHGFEKLEKKWALSKL